MQTLSERGRKDAARPSVLVPLGAVDFAERFTQLFEEHVEGFTGLRGAKRIKSDKEQQMEWRSRPRIAPLVR